MRPVRLALFVWVAPLAFVAACAPPEAPPAAPRPEVVLTGVRMRAYRANQLAATGHARRLAYERSSSNADLDQPSLHLPSRSRLGGQFAQLGGVEIWAPHAEGNLTAQRLEASGGVHLQTGSGVTAQTDRAQFDGNAMATEGNGPVQVRGPAYAIDAIGFRVTSADEDFSFGGPMKSGLGKPKLE